MKDKIIVGLDIGSSKISTLIATVADDGLINVIGDYQTESRGVRKGQIVDIEEASLAVNESIEKAEKMAGVTAGAAFISVSGTHISCQNSKGVVAVAHPEGEISRDDYRRVMEAAKAISLPSSREIIHAIPRSFIVDGQEGIKDPVGMMGVRLEVDTHIIHGASMAIRNLVKCVESVSINVEGVVFSGLASATAVLTETEKELGVVLIDVGGGTTDICVYLESALAFSGVIPIGAKHITNDIAAGLRVSLESAEKIKIALNEKPKRVVQETEEEIEGNLPASTCADRQAGKKVSDDMDLSDLNLPEGLQKISRKTVVEGIVKYRIDEIFSLVREALSRQGLLGQTPAGIVITGGGALTVNALSSCRQKIGLSARIGIPQNISGLIDEIENPSWAGAVGLCRYGARSGMTKAVSSLPFSLPFDKIMARIPLRGNAGKIMEFFKNFLP